MNGERSPHEFDLERRCRLQLPATEIAEERNQKLRARLWNSPADMKARQEFVSRGSEASSHSGCEIALFRPFDDDYSKFARNIIIPLLDGYGRVVYVTDRTFEDSSYRGVLGRPYSEYSDHIREIAKDADESTRKMLELVDSVQGGDPMRSAGREFKDEEWREKVQELFDRLDIAVIDVSTASPNVLWELRECYHRLPPERVIGIARRASVSHLKSHSEAITEATHIPSEPWISGLAIYDPDERELRESFVHNLHERMLGIVVESKKTYLEVLELAHAKESRVGMIWPLLHLGRAACKLHELPESSARLHEAIAIAEETGEDRWSQEIYQNLMSLAQALGDEELFVKAFSGSLESLRTKPPECATETTSVPVEDDSIETVTVSGVEFGAYGWETLTFAPFWVFVTLARTDRLVGDREHAALLALLENPQTLGPILRELVQHLADDFEGCVSRFLSDSRDVDYGLEETAEILDDYLTEESAYAIRLAIVDLGAHLVSVGTEVEDLSASPDFRAAYESVLKPLGLTLDD